MFKTIVLAIAFALVTVGLVGAADNVADAVKADALAPKVADKAADATKPVETPKVADKVADKAADATKPVEAPKVADKVADVAKVTGVVAIAKAADGAVTVTITVPAAKDAKDAKDVVYSVVQDEVGKTLIKLAGNTVTATGTVAEVKGVQTLTVKEVKVQEAKK
jgi:hypothetical protein